MKSDLITGTYVIAKPDLVEANAEEVIEHCTFFNNEFGSEFTGYLKKKTVKKFEKLKSTYLFSQFKEDAQQSLRDAGFEDDDEYIDWHEESFRNIYDIIQRVTRDSGQYVIVNTDICLVIEEERM